MADEHYPPDDLDPGDPGSEPDADLSGTPLDDHAPPLVPQHGDEPDASLPAGDGSVADLPPALDIEPAGVEWGDDGLEQWLAETPEELDEPAVDPQFTGRIEEMIAGDIESVDRDGLVEQALKRRLEGG